MMRQKHAIEVQPAENRPENLENYDEYAEESVKKPLETPVIVVDGETASKDSKPETSVSIVSTTANTPTTTESEIISNVEDVMILRTVKPLCEINAEARIARDCEN